MIGLASAMLATLSAAGCSVLGYRQGAAWILHAALRPGMCWILAAGTAAVGYSLHWFWPFGLITPVIAGALASACLWRTLRRGPFDRMGLDRPSPPARWLGMVLGSCGGLLIASLLSMLLMLLASTRHAGLDQERTMQGEGQWIHALVATANRGFLHHLPLVGPYGDELEALVYILNADRLSRASMARQPQWQELAGLPAMRAALADDELRREIDAIAEGSLLALYRLQRHPRIIALIGCTEIQRCIDGLRPSRLAAEIRGSVAEPIDR